MGVGTSSRIGSRRFAPSKPRSMLTPVRLPPGRFRLATRPNSTALARFSPSLTRWRIMQNSVFAARGAIPRWCGAQPIRAWCSSWWRVQRSTAPSATSRTSTKASSEPYCRVSSLTVSACDRLRFDPLLKFADRRRASAPCSIAGRFRFGLRSSARPTRILIAESAVPADHFPDARFQIPVIASFNHAARAYRHQRAPRALLIGLALTISEQRDGDERRNDEQKFFHDLLRLMSTAPMLTSGRSGRFPNLRKHRGALRFP